MHRAGDAPADDAARKHIDDESHVYEPRPGRDVGEIGDPELIRPSGGELALDQIRRIIRLVAADSGDEDMVVEWIRSGGTKSNNFIAITSERIS